MVIHNAGRHQLTSCFIVAPLVVCTILKVELNLECLNDIIICQHGFSTIIALQSLSYINAGQSEHVCSIFQNETVVEMSNIQKVEK